MFVKFHILIHYIFILKSCVSKSVYDYDYNSYNESEIESFNYIFRPILRIINGETAKLGQFPYQVSFKARARRGYANFCGGTIIKRDIVLSAAHCFEDDSYLRGRTYAHVGTIHTYASGPASDSNGQGQWRKVIAVSEHPEYRFPYNDISLVKIEEPFTYNEYVKAIPYATVTQDYHEACMASGYGFTSWKTKQLPPRLQYISIKTQPMASSNYYGRRSKNFVFLEVGNEGVGQGDSGGPLVCYNSKDPKDEGKGVVVGVTCGRKSSSSLDFYTRVSQFLSFVEAEDFTRRKRRRRRHGGDYGTVGGIMGGGMLMALMALIGYGFKMFMNT